MMIVLPQVIRARFLPRAFSVATDEFAFTEINKIKIGYWLHCHRNCMYSTYTLPFTKSFLLSGGPSQLSLSQRARFLPLALFAVTDRFALAAVVMSS